MAMLTHLEDTAPEIPFSNPYFWAGFVLVGV
jgi:CHAT domain-containing protein